MSSPTKHNADDITIITTKYLRQNMDATLVIDGQRFEFELDDLDEYFSQKAKDELRETPETVAQAHKELKELLAGKRGVSRTMITGIDG